MGVCRICLESNTESNVPIPVNIIESLDRLFPPLNNNLKKICTVCETCFESIVAANQFICTVTKTENKVFKERQCSDLDIIDLRIFHSDSSLLTSEVSTCRTCLKFITKPQIFLTQNSTNLMHHTIVREMLECCGIYLKYELTDKPIMCIDCWIALQAVYTFKDNYMEAKKKVIQFCKLQNYPLGDVNDDMLMIMKEFISEDLDMPEIPLSKSKTECFKKSEDLLLRRIYYEISDMELDIPQGYLGAIQEKWSQLRPNERPLSKSLIIYRLKMMLGSETVTYAEQEKVKAEVRSNMGNDMKVNNANTLVEDHNNQFVDKGGTDTNSNQESCSHQKDESLVTNNTSRRIEEIRYAVIKKDNNYSTSKDIIKPFRKHVLELHACDAEYILTELPYKCDRCDFSTVTEAQLKGHQNTEHSSDDTGDPPTRSYDLKLEPHSDDEDKLLNLLEQTINFGSDWESSLETDQHTLDTVQLSTETDQSSSTPVTNQMVLTTDQLSLRSELPSSKAQLSSDGNKASRLEQSSAVMDQPASNMLTIVRSKENEESVRKWSGPVNRRTEEPTVRRSSKRIKEYNKRMEHQPQSSGNNRYIEQSRQVNRRIEERAVRRSSKRITQSSKRMKNQPQSSVNNRYIVDKSEQCKKYKQYTPGQSSEHKTSKKVVHVCKMCNYIAKNLSQFTEHMRVIHGEVIYLCERCYYATNSTLVFDRHMTQLHADDKKYIAVMLPYKCYKCDFRSVSIKAFINHLKEKHLADRLCAFSRQVMPKPYDVEALPNIELESVRKSPNSISESQRMNQPSFEVKRPSSKTDQPSFEVKRPSSETDQPSFGTEQSLFGTDLTSDEAAVVDKSQLKCSKCNCETHSECTMFRHKKYKKARYRCKKCFLGKIRTNAFRKHIMKMHTDDKEFIGTMLPYKCNQCNFRSPSQCQHQSHISRKHNDHTTSSTSRGLLIQDIESAINCNESSISPLQPLVCNMEQQFVKEQLTHTVPKIPMYQTSSTLGTDQSSLQVNPIASGKEMLLPEQEQPQLSTTPQSPEERRSTNQTPLTLIGSKLSEGSEASVTKQPPTKVNEISCNKNRPKKLSPWSRTSRPSLKRIKPVKKVLIVRLHRSLFTKEQIEKPLFNNGNVTIIPPTEGDKLSFPILNLPITTAKPPSVTLKQPSTTIKFLSKIKTASTTINQPFSTLEAPSATLIPPIETEKLPTTTLKPQSTTIKSRSTTAEHLFTSVRSLSKPPTSTTESQLMPVQPPFTTIESPSTSLLKPPSVTTEPPCMIGKPRSVTLKLPTSTTVEPLPSTGKPPSASVKTPSTTVEGLSITLTPPTTLVRHPTMTLGSLSESTLKLSTTLTTTKEPRSTTLNLPSVSIKPLSTLVDPPSTVSKPQSVTSKLPTTTVKSPSRSLSKLLYTSSTIVEPMTAKPPSVKTHSTPIEPLSMTLTSPTKSVRLLFESTLKLSSTTLITTNESPSSTVKLPSTSVKPPTTTVKPPSAAEESWLASYQKWVKKPDIDIARKEPDNSITTENIIKRSESTPKEHPECISISSSPESTTKELTWCNKALYQCKECNYHTTIHIQLREHMKLVHEEVTDKTNSFTSYAQHFQWYLEEMGTDDRYASKRCRPPYKCGKCSFRTEDADKFRLHLVQEHARAKTYLARKLLYKCNACNFRGVTNLQLVFHREHQHGELFPRSLGNKAHGIKQSTSNMNCLLFGTTPPSSKTDPSSFLVGQPPPTREMDQPSPFRPTKLIEDYKNATSPPSATEDKQQTTTSVMKEAPSTMENMPSITEETSSETENPLSTIEEPYCCSKGEYTCTDLSEIAIEESSLAVDRECAEKEVINDIDDDLQVVSMNDQSYSGTSECVVEWSGMERKCPECEFKTKHPGRFTRHMQHWHKRLYCKKCNYHTLIWSQFSKHLKLFHKNVSYKCQKYDFLAQTKLQLSCHLEHQHNGDSACSCPKTPKIDVRELPGKNCNKLLHIPLQRLSWTEEPWTIGVVNSPENPIDESLQINQEWVSKDDIDNTVGNLFPANDQDHITLENANDWQHTEIEQDHDEEYISLNQLYKCEKCDFLTITELQLRDHVKLKHNNNNTYSFLMNSHEVVWVASSDDEEELSNSPSFDTNPISSFGKERPPLQEGRSSSRKEAVVDQPSFDLEHISFAKGRTPLEVEPAKSYNKALVIRLQRLSRREEPETEERRITGRRVLRRHVKRSHVANEEDLTRWAPNDCHKGGFRTINERQMTRQVKVGKAATSREPIPMSSSDDKKDVSNMGAMSDRESYISLPELNRINQRSIVLGEPSSDTEQLLPRSNKMSNMAHSLSAMAEASSSNRLGFSMSSETASSTLPPIKPAKNVDKALIIRLNRLLFIQKEQSTMEQRLSTETEPPSMIEWLSSTEEALSTRESQHTGVDPLCVKEEPLTLLSTAENSMSTTEDPLFVIADSLSALEASQFKIEEPPCAMEDLPPNSEKVLTMAEDRLYIEEDLPSETCTMETITEKLLAMKEDPLFISDDPLFISDDPLFVKEDVSYKLDG